MKNLIRVLNNTKKIDPFVILDRVIKRQKLGKFLIELNTEEQLYDKGIDSLGDNIVPYYKQSTIAIKKRKGQPYTRVTLKDTGKMYKTWRVKLDKTYITISADLEKKGFDLELKYGTNIVGITDENLQKFINKIKSEYKEEILRQVFKRM